MVEEITAEKIQQMLETIRKYINLLLARRNEILTKIDEERRKSEEVIKGCWEELKKIDEEIKRTDEELMKLGITLEKIGVAGASSVILRKSGRKALILNYIRSLPIGAEIRDRDVREKTGVTSGYRGVVLKELVKAGVLSYDPERRIYRVIKYL